MRGCYTDVARNCTNLSVKRNPTTKFSHVHRANTILSVYINQKCSSRKDNPKHVQKNVFSVPNNSPHKKPLDLMNSFFVCFHGLKNKFSWKYSQNLLSTGASSNRRPEITNSKTENLFTHSHHTMIP